MENVIARPIYIYIYKTKEIEKTDIIRQIFWNTLRNSNDDNIYIFRNREKRLKKITL